MISYSFKLILNISTDTILESFTNFNIQRITSLNCRINYLKDNKDNATWLKLFLKGQRVFLNRCEIYINTDIYSLIKSFRDIAVYANKVVININNCNASEYDPEAIDFHQLKILFLSTLYPRIIHVTVSGKGEIKIFKINKRNTKEAVEVIEDLCSFAMYYH